MLQRCHTAELLLVIVVCLPAAAGGEEHAASVRGPMCGANKRTALGVVSKPAEPDQDLAVNRGRMAKVSVRVDSSTSAAGGIARNGGTDSQGKVSVLQTLLEVRRRFGARQMQAGLRPQPAAVAQDGTPARTDAEAEQVPCPAKLGATTAGTGAAAEGNTGQWDGAAILRELNAARRRRSDAAAAALSPVSPTPPTDRQESQGSAKAQSESKVQEWECIVCGEELMERIIGRVDCNSTHVFCFDCIHKWGSSIENSCPLCKQAFHKIDKLVRAPKDLWNGRQLSRPSTADATQKGEIIIAGERWNLLSSVEVLEKKQRVEDMVPDEEGCTECGGGSTTGILIMCDGCDVTLCLDCADLTQDTMPREDEPWFCEECDGSDEACTAAGRRRARRRRRAQQAAAHHEDALADGSRRRARQRRSMGEADARMAARALGRNYRSVSRFRV